MFWYVHGATELPWASDGNLIWALGIAGNIYSPSSTSGIDRDMANDGKYNIMTLAEFLTLAKNSSVGVFIDIQVTSHFHESITYACHWLLTYKTLLRDYNLRPADCWGGFCIYGAVGWWHFDVNFLMSSIRRLEQNAVYIRQKKNLAVVDGVVEAMKAAGYTNPSEKVMLQSEDSSALARLRTLNVSYPLMYRIVYSTIAPVSITPADFVDIKEFATSVSIPKKFIDNMDSQTGFIGGPSQVVQWAHAQNLTAYFFFLRNENTAFVFDYKGDPTLQMYSLAQNYQMDGFVTDYPSSAVNYLGKCVCFEMTEN